ncbi:unnamed protein product [Cuscuta campestris]|uniref:Uncharacterized protein n=1 Tax=Cuscuta campestris TaxID=132261 RepID=A0A484LXV7_9ASTE|nr:unnamed protein product [Cuscuta campestris]
MRSSLPESSTLKGGFCSKELIVSSAHLEVSWSRVRQEASLFIAAKNFSLMGRQRKRIKRSWEGPVEKLPHEILGDILSRVRVAQYVIKASLTCKKWREAYCKHLRALSFDIADFKVVNDQDPVPRIELFITKAIFQTTALRKLSILMSSRYTFSAGTVGTWLLFVRETLSELVYKDGKSTTVNVLDMFGRRKLESLSLSNYRIGRGELNFERFACLTSLSLCRVDISVEDLNRFLNAPLKLESLKLDEFSSPERAVEFHCPTLKTLFLDDMKLYQFMLESSSIECLQVKECYFSSFQVRSSKTLRDIKLSNSEARFLEIEQTDNLESFELTRTCVAESNLFPMMIQAPKLKRFHFWGFMEKYMYIVRGDDRSGLVLDLERMAICSPQLSHLAIFCDKRLDGLVYKFGDSTSLEKVTVLEIGSDGFDGFAEWTEKLLKCCPNVEKVIVHWDLYLGKIHQLNDLSVQSSLLVKMMSKYQHIKMQFAFSYAY